MAIEFDSVSLDPQWPLGPTGEQVQKWQKIVDGVCARATTLVGTTLVGLARGRAYSIVPTKSGQHHWYLLGDPFVSPLVRDNGLHEKLIAMRVISGSVEGLPVNWIVWGAGQYAAKAFDLKMREVEKHELRGVAPLALLKFAAQSRRAARKAGFALKTGLFCYDQGDLERLQDVAREVTHGKLILRNDEREIVGSASRAAAERWIENIKFSTALLTDAMVDHSEKTADIVWLDVGAKKDEPKKD